MSRIAFLGFSREHKEALQYFARMAGLVVCSNTTQEVDYVCIGDHTDKKRLKRKVLHSPRILNENEFLTLKDLAQSERLQEIRISEKAD